MTKILIMENMTTHSLDYVIDFHSHILPGIDDGSTDMEMSRQMLELSASQGIKVILATPHFYADRVSLDHFLKYRDSSLNSIRHFSENYGIKILAGAEVAYFSGMSTANGLDRLTVSGTSLLLLEMPFRPWTGDDIREVRNLIRIGIQPVSRGYHSSCSAKRFRPSASRTIGHLLPAKTASRR